MAHRKLQPGEVVTFGEIKKRVAALRRSADLVIYEDGSKQTLSKLLKDRPEYE